MSDNYDQEAMIAVDQKISDQFDETFDQIDWIVLLMRIELIYGIEIPDELNENIDLTLSEFTHALLNLPIIPDNLYPEFFDIKTTMATLMRRYIDLEVKTDAASKKEQEEINVKLEELNDSLNDLLGRKLIN